MRTSEKQEFRVKGRVNFRDSAVTMTYYFMLVTIVAVEEVPSFFEKL